MWHKAFEHEEVNNIIQALGIRFGRSFQMAFSAAGKQEYIENRRKYYQYPQKRRKRS